MTFNGSFVTEDSIESLIYLFISVWFFVINGLSNAMIESPKGEYGVTVMLMNGHFIRIKIRCCDYLHVLLLEKDEEGCKEMNGRDEKFIINLDNDLLHNNLGIEWEIINTRTHRPGSPPFLFWPIFHPNSSVIAFFSPFLNNLHVSSSLHPSPSFHPS